MGNAFIRAQEERRDAAFSRAGSSITDQQPALIKPEVKTTEPGARLAEMAGLMAQYAGRLDPQFIVEFQRLARQVSKTPQKKRKVTVWTALEDLLVDYVAELGPAVQNDLVVVNAQRLLDEHRAKPKKKNEERFHPPANTAIISKKKKEK